MNVVVSVPDSILVRADMRARRLGISRSELFARALEAYVRPLTAAEITEMLDALHSDHPTELDPGLRRAQGRTLSPWRH